MKDGTAKIGCGMLDRIHQSTAKKTLRPRGTSARLIATPSGMLWIAIVIVTMWPRRMPPSPPKDTPTPIYKKIKMDISNSNELASVTTIDRVAIQANLRLRRSSAASSPP